MINERLVSALDMYVLCSNSRVTCYKTVASVTPFVSLAFVSALLYVLMSCGRAEGTRHSNCCSVDSVRDLCTGVQY